MAFKGTVHRGTPYHHIGNKGTAHEGMEHGAKPRGYEHTSRDAEGRPGADYRSDTRGYQHSDRSGTPYNSQNGNSDEYRRLVTRDAHGNVTSEHGINHNDPRDNGKGVIFDGANRYEEGYMPKPERTMDSPVPEHAPWFGAEFIAKEDRAHAGSGIEHTATDDLLSIGGVMSRGMVGTSSRHGPETELMQDDEMHGEGHATQSQPKGSVKHLKE